ncbi:GDSL-type esterase/lipase family protein [Geminicoccus flavidas]|uniref:GDSL-type esterase/lipase family protein n=1 Tax=Geminicoccus flavidas TaxID=2506407 RepID=UPI00135C818C|nr:GDSL-type esterase/lipase family protein [Geminicoccus flavidas]
MRARSIAILFFQFFGMLALAHQVVAADCPDPDLGPASTTARNEIWRAEVARQAREARKIQPELILLGDSITAQLKYRSADVAFSLYTDVFTTYNFASSGDNTSNLLWKIEHGVLDRINPSIVMLMIGTNDQACKRSRELVEGAIAVIVGSIRQRLPQSQIVLQSVLPREADLIDIPALNNALEKRYRDNPQVHFVDLTALFSSGGKLHRELYKESTLVPPKPLLHPTAKGARLIAETLMPLLQHLVQSNHDNSE